MTQDNKCLVCGCNDLKVIHYDSAWGDEYDLVCQGCGNSDLEKMQQVIWN